jgi:hypothetical protein
MKSRRTFLTAVAAGSAGLALSARDAASAQMTPAPLTPATTPVPSPAATATGKLPSFGAAAIAATMREIDPALTQEQIDAIAKAIDANRDAAKALNPKKKRLKNSDEPILRFAVPGGDA